MIKRFNGVQGLIDLKGSPALEGINVEPSPCLEEVPGGVLCFGASFDGVGKWVVLFQMQRYISCNIYCQVMCCL